MSSDQTALSPLSPRYASPEASHKRESSVNRVTRQTVDGSSEPQLTTTQEIHRSEASVDRRSLHKDQAPPLPTSTEQVFKKPAMPRFPNDSFQPRGAPRAVLTKINVPGSNTSDAEFDESPAPSTAQTPAMSRSPSRAGNAQESNSLIHEMRRKVLSRDFWMKDENAKVCFNCGDTFTAFRRKHHCRTCGQIYDSKCTVLIPGRMFGQPGRLRICKTCENIIVGDDSSEYSEEDDSQQVPSHGKTIRFSGLPPALPQSHSRTSLVDASVHGDAGRGSLEARRRSTLNPLESLAPSLARPSSSRSLKSLSSRPMSASHRHRRSYHQHMRSFPSNYSNVAFDQASSSGRQPLDTLSQHKDQIIDPDIAPFMSDEGSSDEEAFSIAAALNTNVADTGAYSGSAVGASRKSRPRPSSSRSIFDLSLQPRDPETASIRSSRPGTRRRATARTMSMGSTMAWPPMSPRIVRSENLFTDGQSFFGSTTTLVPENEHVQTNGTSQAPRQASQEPSLAELNKSSLQHVRTLLRQLLKDGNIDSPKRWEKSLVPILLRCAEDIDPNIQRGDDIDIRHYVKLKKAPNGSPRDTAYVSGVVFSKNMALKGMRRSIPDARLLLVSFPIVYARHQQHFMSLDAVIAQEKEYLRNLVRRIVALKPDVVLAQKQVAGFALELLRDAGVTVAYSLKESVLHAVSRCTQSRIITSVDKLTMESKHLGSCEQFDIKTLLFTSYRKTYFFISGCQPDLGCTIVLRGGDLKTLVKLKWITEFMCYVVYNLKLETSLIRDQFSSAPTIPPAPSDQSENTKNDALATVATDGGTALSELSPSAVNRGERVDIETHPIGNITDFQKVFEELDKRVLSISPSVRLSKPHLLIHGLDQENRLAIMQGGHRQLTSTLAETAPSTEREAFELIRTDIIHADIRQKPEPVRETLREIQSVEYARADRHYATLRRRWEAFIAGSRDPFSPLSHQQIVILFSVVSRPSQNACEGPDLLALGFYQEHSIEDDFEPDMPLGEFVERLCEQASSACLASRCDKKMIDHHRNYVHGEGQIRIATTKQAAKVRDMENTILMWSVCRECAQETPVVPMSRNTWKYSFAKYLELSFWSCKLEPRAGFCPHDISKSHTRYFGFHNLAVSVTYSPISVMEVTMPRDHIFWMVEKDISLKNDEFVRIKDRLQRFMSSINKRIDSIRLENVKAEHLEKCKLELESYQQRVRDEHSFLLNKLQDKYTNSRYFEVIPLNRAVRAMQEKVSNWDQTFAEFERKYFPSEKDIRRLAAQQLKNVYLSRTELAEVERLEEKDGRVSPISIHRQDALQAQSTERVANLAIEAEKQSLLLPSLPSTDDTITSRQQTATSIGSHASRVVDELDLAKSPESPIAREKAAALESELNVSDQGDTNNDDPSQSSQKGVQSDNDSPDSRTEANPANLDRTKSVRRQGRSVSPALLRSRTQPFPLVRRPSALPSPLSSETPRPTDVKTTTPSLIPISKGSTQAPRPLVGDLKQPVQGLGATAQFNKGSSSSMIPRSKNYHRIESKVSALAKHFEQMSREFERERLRERRQRAARVWQAQVPSTASVQPVVEVFKDAEDAVYGHEHPGQSAQKAGGSHSQEGRLTTSALAHADGMDKVDALIEQKLERAQHGSDSPEDPRSEQSTLYNTNTFSDNETIHSDVEPSALTDSEELPGGHEPNSEPVEEPHMELFDIPKHDKTSIMRMLSNFWSERSASGWAPLDYPMAYTDHIFGDQDVILREDELSSLIAFSLESPDYQSKCRHFRDRVKAQTQVLSPTAPSPANAEMESTLLGETATHLTYKWAAGPATMQCRVLFAEGFDAMRQRCGVSDRFVESLSRCVKWDSRGGKSKSIFLKTLDERFIVKSLPSVEAQAFLRFAPDYFDYMSKCLFHSLPSALAKMLGLYHITLRNPVTGIDFSGFLQVMENVFYEGQSSKMFDLKGSMRNRRAQSTGERNEVLLDENLLDYLSQSPVYIRNHSNSFLTSSISNDTLFCAKQNVMDYSLIVGLYDDRAELMVGIIDYIRTYTWDKKLESWIKDRGKNKPTVRSPKEYRNRFRTSIAKYFPLAPSCWQIFGGHRPEPPRAWWDSIGTAKEDQLESRSIAPHRDIETEPE